MLKNLKKQGPAIAVITQGSKGAWVYEGKNIHHAKPYRVKVKSTAGAGDAFASGFLAGIIKKDAAHALELGMANAASVIQYFGTKNKLLHYKEAKSFIEKHKQRIAVRKVR